VLKFDGLVLAQITDVGNTRPSARFDQHPANVTPIQSLMRVVRVEISVGVSVVSAVTSGPPLDRTLDRASTRNSKEVLQRF
jgi:hypothetical protein